MNGEPTATAAAEPQTLPMLLRALQFRSFAIHHEDVARKAEAEGWNFNHHLRHLAELELADRRTRRIERLLKTSSLPAEKTLSALKLEKLPTKVRRQLPALCEGAFVDRAENVLAFALPGPRTTHPVSA